MKKTIKGYMTFRNGEPLAMNTLSMPDYTLYLEKAPCWQDGDKSVPVTIVWHEKKPK